MKEFKIKVKIPVEHEKETYQGLESVPVIVKKRKGYAIETLQCTRCGLVDNLGEDEERKCKKCGSKSMKKYDKTMEAWKTENVINSKLMWKCPKCMKMYDKPQTCCLGNEVSDPQKDEMEKGWFCMGCNKIYKKKVKCCSNYPMIPGRYYFATREEYLKKPKFMVPL